MSQNKDYFLIYLLNLFNNHNPFMCFTCAIRLVDHRLNNSSSCIDEPVQTHKTVHYTASQHGPTHRQ